MEAMQGYWEYLFRPVARNYVVIGRRARAPALTDGAGAGLCVGPSSVGRVQEMLYTMDLARRETEVKLLMGCSEGKL